MGMEHPKEDYARACTLGYILIFAFYGATAAIGYYYFGESLTNSFTERLRSPSLLLPAIIAILVKIQIAVPPNLAPPVLVIEGMVGVNSELGRFAVRCAMICMSVLVAVFCSGA